MQMPYNKSITRTYQFTFMKNLGDFEQFKSVPLTYELLGQISFEKTRK